MLSYQMVLGLFCVFVGFITILLPSPRRSNPRTATKLPPQVQRFAPYLMGVAMVGLGIVLIVQGFQ